MLITEKFESSLSSLAVLDAVISKVLDLFWNTVRNKDDVESYVGKKAQKEPEIAGQSEPNTKKDVRFGNGGAIPHDNETRLIANVPRAAINLHRH